MSKIIFGIVTFFIGLTFLSIYSMYKVYEEIDNDDWT